MAFVPGVPASVNPARLTVIVMVSMNAVFPTSVPRMAALQNVIQIPTVLNLVCRNTVVGIAACAAQVVSGKNA
jgi:hypothetical protein